MPLLYPEKPEAAEAVSLALPALESAVRALPNQDS